MQRLRQRLSKLPAGIFSVLTIGLILWLTLAPKPLGDEPLPLFPGADKIAHALMFGFLTAMFMLDWERKSNWKTVPITLIIIFSTISAIFGVVIEFIQDAMQIGRGLEFGDMVADTAGSYLIALFWITFQHYWSKS